MSSSENHSSVTPVPPSRSRRATGLAIALLLLAIPVQYAYLKAGALATGKGLDFVIYYTAGRVASAGLDPYNSGPLDVDHPSFRQFILDYSRWATPEDPAPRTFKKWSGSHPYPPSMYLLFQPISRLEWFPALATWIALFSLLALACGTLTWTFDPTNRHRDVLTQVVVGLLFMFHPATSNHLGCGQASLLLCGGVALGQWARRYERDWLASFLWSFCLVKPHIGFELAALTLLVGGWRFSIKVAVWAVLLNVVGGLATTGNPLMVLRMPEAARHFYSPSALYVDGPLAPKVVSWNRPFYFATGQIIMLSPPIMLLGHLLWMGTIVGLTRLRRLGPLSVTYALAAAACGSIFWSSSHNYDLVLLVLVVPFGFYLWDHGYKADVAYLLVLLTIITPPASLAERAIAQLHINSNLASLLISYRCFAVLGLALYLLIRGQPRQPSADSAVR